MDFNFGILGFPMRQTWNKALNKNEKQYNFAFWGEIITQWKQKSMLLLYKL